MNRKFFFVISSFAYISLLLAIVYYGYRRHISSIQTESTRENKISCLADLHDQGKIAMLGDSLTEGGRWDELLGSNVINRGISGDTTSVLLDRLPEIIAEKQVKIFLMVGVNDLTGGVADETITHNYQVILLRLKNNLPNTIIYVQSVLPINSRLYFNNYGIYINNGKIDKLNLVIRKTCNLFGIKYVNVYPSMIDHGELNPRLSFDGIHLNGKGYVIWKNIIKENL